MQPAISPSAISPQAKRSLGESAIYWIILIVLLVCVAPVIGCSAFGLILSLRGSANESALAVGPSVGVIRLEGPIMSGSSGGFGGSSVDATVIIKLAEQADKDPNIKAIVLRIDSPGGGVVASDEIYHALQKVDKPIVVSMGDLAASGGYYVAMSADYIFATPNTLTGSIGVISEFVDASQIMDDAGVKVTVIKSGEVKDFGSFSREMTAEEHVYWQSLINETYDGFVKIVAVGRKMDETKVRHLADGRVYSGKQAVELGLVDEIGYFDDATKKAAEMGGIIGEPNVIELAPAPDFWKSLGSFSTAKSGPFSLELLRQMVAPTFEFRYLGPF